MKIRLVIPECKDWDGIWYSKDSYCIDQRIEMLDQVMQKSDDVGLVVTSHNFFAFSRDYSTNAKDIAKDVVEKEIIPRLKKIENKKPLITGFDLLEASQTKKRTGKKRKAKGAGSDIRFNPYDRGIDAIVCYIELKKNSYLYRTHIWECWQKDGCDEKGFEEQNGERVFCLRGKKIGLLSCGDIASDCHNAGELLPEVDIYVDLSHKSLRGHSSQYWIPPKMITEYKKCSHVLVTQQVNDVSRYYREQKYPYIFSESAKPKPKPKIEKLLVNGEKKGVFIDVAIP